MLSDATGVTASEPYLIAHVVRGSPAFDIAIQLQIGSEPGWIIPTSGHRAYPYWFEELSHLLTYLKHHDIISNPPPAPADWPDHYGCNDRKHTKELKHDSGPDLLKALGLLSRAEPINRRI